jgi:hypothetical protein
MYRALLIACAFLASSVGGQTPSPQPSPPGGPLIGLVRNPSGGTLSDVSVTLIGETAATRTDSSGRFALRDASPGSHTALFRRIGYESEEYRWISKPAAASQIEIVMTPIAQQLALVVVEAPGTKRKRGTSSIAGTVLDSAGHALGGTDVRVLGTGESTTTDSAGNFDFQTLAAGSYIVRARRQGLSSVNYVMQIADDDARRITLKMHPSPRRTSSRDSTRDSGFGIQDMGYDAFDRRERGSSAITVLGPADLFRENGASLDFVLQPYLLGGLAPPRSTSSVSAGTGSSTDGDCLLIDGRRAAYQPIRTFTAREVQLIEVIRANAWPDDFIAAQMEGLGQCRGTRDRHPIYIVLWTRSMR